jgi:proline racemase
MYGGFLVPPDDSGAHFGVLFWHKDGFSTACGHGTIALGCWATENAIVPSAKDGRNDVVIDLPSGRVVAQVHKAGGKVSHVDFVNVPSYQLGRGLPVDLESTGVDIVVDLSWGGATYAYVQARDLGLEVRPSNYDEFVRLGREIQAALGARADHKGLSLYGVTFVEELDDSDTEITQRNVVVFADGQIDRSPCGSGTAARVAALYAQGKVTGSKPAGAPLDRQHDLPGGD